MQRFSEHEARRSAWAVRVFVAVAAVGFAISAVRLGLLQNDDSLLFSQWAEKLRAHGFDYVGLARDTRFVYSPLVYSGWLTVVAVLQAACGPEWRYALIGLNYACAVATVAGVLLLVRRLTGSALAVAVTGALAVAGVELWLWVPYVLSDSTFALLAFVLYAVGVERLSAPLTPRGALGVLALAVVVAVYRPGGLPLLVVVLTGLALNRALPGDPGRRAGWARRLVAAELLAAGLLVVAHAELMRAPERWPIRPLAPWVHSLSGEARRGMVMFHRPELNHAPPVATADFVGLTLDKLLHFYSPSAPSLRLERKVLWLISLPLVYALAAAGAWRMFQARGGLSDRAWWAAWLALQVLMLVGLFHGLQVVDRDWRYRLPCLPPLLVLAGLGWPGGSRRPSSRRSRSSSRATR